MRTDAEPGAGARPGTRAFLRLDEHIVSGVGGGVLARVGSSAAARALEGHLTRRLAQLGFSPLVAHPPGGLPLWSDVGALLGLAHAPCDPPSYAAEIADAASARRIALIVPLPNPGTWDRSVAAELSVLAGPPVVFITHDADDPAQELGGEVFEIGGALDDEERARWWRAAAEHACATLAADDLTLLDACWTSMQRALVNQDVARLPRACGDEGALFEALALVGRAWPAAEISRLGGDGETLDSLVRMGIVRVVRGWVSIDPAFEEEAASARSTASPDAVRAVIAPLLACFSEDPWAHARAAELLVGVGDYDEAEAAHARALTAAADGTMRRDLSARWSELVAAFPADEQLARRTRAAERALALGDAEEAYRWAQGAAAVGGSDPEVVRLVGRAALLLGDLVAAKVAFEQALAKADEPEARALIYAELAEATFACGDCAEATRLANEAIASTSRPATKLLARNTLGKILLALARWDDAEKHFAEDAWIASTEGLVTEHLRARLNRGVALVSKGYIDEARAIFEAVLVEGEKAGNDHACAFALDNLAIVATRSHAYTSALAYHERTLRLRQRLGDRAGVARTLSNLAALRCRLGLLDHAEHAIAFCRRILGAGMPPARSAHFAIVASRIALARGNTVEARREVARAVTDSRVADMRNYVGQAYRLLARVALEEGDLAGATEALRQASDYDTTDFARGEVLLLRAMLARASGAPDEKLTEEALNLARLAGDDELLLDAYTLLCKVYRDAGRTDAARSILEQALGLRDRIANGLEDHVRNAFLSHPNARALARLCEELKPTASCEAPEGAAGRTSIGGGARVKPEIVGDSPAIRGLLAAIKRVARSNSTILIHGESGTGKELVAEAIHRASDRANGPLVTVNCAALVETLLLSELFGHEKGAFTGAVSRRRGRFELADGGTLFLDEIGDISPRTQVVLLRAIQEKTFERVGSTTPIRSDVRIICATHRDLAAMVERGEFREDLYYRLRGITLELPPLRERMEDLPRIAEHLLARIAAERNEPPKVLSAEALELLSRHRWPGNIRELENSLRAASLFADERVITASCLADTVRELSTPLRSAPPSAERLKDADEDEASAPEEPSPPTAWNAAMTAAAYTQVRHGGSSLSSMKRRLERECIAQALAETRGNITRAAMLLGMKRPRLSQLVKQYGLSAVSEVS